MAESDGVNQTLAAAFARVGVDLVASAADGQRRRIDGTILDANGVSGIVTGGCSIFFEREVAVLALGHVDNALAVPYEHIISLQFGGRGTLIHTSGGGWFGGGFGIAGALEGVGFATVMNALTTRKTTSIETIINFAWRSGRATLLNQRYLPQQIAHFLAPVVSRIEAAQKDLESRPPDPTREPQLADLASQLQRLAELRSSGALSESEFVAAKARVLSSSD